MNGTMDGVAAKTRPIEELKNLIEACVKSNFVGVENSRLYSQTYYGTKNLVQEFIDEGEQLSDYPRTAFSRLKLEVADIP